MEIAFFPLRAACFECTLLMMYVHVKHNSELRKYSSTSTEQKQKFADCCFSELM